MIRKNLQFLGVILFFIILYLYSKVTFVPTNSWFEYIKGSLGFLLLLLFILFISTISLPLKTKYHYKNYILISFWAFSVMFILSIMFYVWWSRFYDILYYTLPPIPVLFLMIIFSYFESTKNYKISFKEIFSSKIELTQEEQQFLENDDKDYRFMCDILENKFIVRPEIIDQWKACRERILKNQPEFDFLVRDVDEKLGFQDI